MVSKGKGRGEEVKWALYCSCNTAVTGRLKSARDARSAGFLSEVPRRVGAPCGPLGLGLRGLRNYMPDDDLCIHVKHCID